MSKTRFLVTRIVFQRMVDLKDVLEKLFVSEEAKKIRTNEFYRNTTFNGYYQTDGLPSGT